MEFFRSAFESGVWFVEDHARKIVVALAVLAGIAALVWLLAFRGPSPDPAPASSTTTLPSWLPEPAELEAFRTADAVAPACRVAARDLLRAIESPKSGGTLRALNGAFNEACAGQVAPPPTTEPAVE